MGLFFLILALVILFLILSNIYVFIRIFKHKKRYFFTVGIGFIIKIKLFELCFVIYQRKGFNIVRVKKGGFLHTMKPIDIKNINKEFIICITENIKIKQLSLKIILGTDEAKNTAIYGGMLSAGLDFLYKRLKLNKNSYYDIIPEYNREFFSIDVLCILKINLVNSTINYIIKNLKKVVHRNESYTGHYADNNE